MSGGEGATFLMKCKPQNAILIMLFIFVAIGDPLECLCFHKIYEIYFELPGFSELFSIHLITFAKIKYEDLLERIFTKLIFRWLCLLGSG